MASFSQSALPKCAVSSGYNKGNRNQYSFLTIPGVISGNLFSPGADLPTLLELGREFNHGSLWRAKATGGSRKGPRNARRKVLIQSMAHLPGRRRGGSLVLDTINAGFRAAIVACCHPNLPSIQRHVCVLQNALFLRPMSF